MSNRNSRFERKVTIVTGGAGGLGQAITAALVEEGARVAIFDTNPDAIDRALDELARPDSVMGAIVDVRSRESVTSGVAEVVAAFGGIDILIAAAGGSLGTPRDIDDI